MTREEINEGNKLIAKWIGAVRVDIKSFTQSEYFQHPSFLHQEWTNTTGGSYEDSTIYCETELQYNTSWDWLMPVVEKISEPEVKEDKIIRSGADVKILYKACHLHFQPDEDFEDCDEFKIQTQGETKIESVYKAVVQFIRWHNTQSK